LNEFGGDPLECWNYLKTNYGEEAMRGTAIGQTLVNLICTPMESCEHFNDFILKFERDATFCGLNDDCKLGILCMDGKNEFKLRILPERLNGAIEIALRERRSYASAKDLFLQTSQLQRQSAGGYRHDKSSSKDLKAVYSKTSNKVSADSASNSDNDSDSDHKNKDDKVKCYNCQKFGHISSQCTERCTRCSKSKHKSKNCPKRVDAQ